MMNDGIVRKDINLQCLMWAIYAAVSMRSKRIKMSFVCP
jgi:hypothetical protein